MNIPLLSCLGIHLRLGGEMGEGGQKVQTSNYKIDTFWEYNGSAVTIILTVLYCIFENG